MIQHFLTRAAAEASRPIPAIAPEAAARLMRYAWPSNIRELQNAVQRAFILCRGNRIERSDLPAKVAGIEVGDLNTDEALFRRMTLDELEHEYVRSVLASVAGNKSEAATILGIDHKTLYRKLEDDESEATAEPPSPAAPRR